MVFVGYAAGLVSVVCWIMTLIKMFSDKQDGSVLKAVLGILCPLWAFIWGWMNAGKLGTKNLMLTWTITIVVGVACNLMQVSAAI